jgi:hypothetical protein
MTPEFASLVDAGISGAIGRMRVHGIARVESFDATKRTITAQPLTRRPVTDEDGVIAYRDPQPVQNVPVYFPGGAAFSLTWDLAAGDTVFLAYLDFSPMGWREKGEIADAGDAQQNGPSYPIAFPWFRPRGAAGPAEGTADGVAVRVESGALVVGTGAMRAALAELVRDALQTLANAFDGWTPVPNDGGAALKTALTSALAGWPPDLHASNLRADP